MNIHHVLLFSFFSDLCGGNSELIRTNSPVFTGPEGGNGTITCLFKMTGSRKLFCRNECKDEDVLIRTNKISANNGRYSLKYKTNRSGGGILSVTIKHLTQYDSGWYSCGLGGSVAPDTYQDFEIRVSDALLDRKSGFILTNAVGGNIEYPCRYAANRSSMFFCRGECKRQEDVLIETDENGAQKGRYGIKFKEDSALGLYATITQAVKSDSGGYRCGYGRALSPDSYHTFLLLVDDPPTAKPNWNRQIFSTSVPSATRPLTTTQSLSSSSGSSTTSPDFPETSNQPTPAAFSYVPQHTSSHIPSHPLPLVVCVPVVGMLLLASSLLFLYIRKMKKNKAEALR